MKLFGRRNAFIAATILCLVPCVSAAGPIDPNNPPAGRFSDEWAEIYIGENKAGYAHSAMTRLGDRVESAMTFHMVLGRVDQPVKVTLVQRVTETLDGVPLAFSTETDMSIMKSSVHGTVKDGRVEIVTSQYGLEQKQEFDFPKGALMSWGVFRETLVRGLEPGTTFKLKSYSPELRLDGAVETETRIGKKESFTHKGKTLEGLRVSVELQSPVGTMEMISWVREDGIPLKSVMPVPGLGDMILVGTDQKTAMAEFVPPEFFMNTVIKADRKIDYKNAGQIRYRILAKGPGVSFEDLPETDAQRILAKTPNSVDVEVRRQTHRSIGRRHEVDQNRARSEPRTSVRAEPPFQNRARQEAERPSDEATQRRSDEESMTEIPDNQIPNSEITKPTDLADYLSSNLMINLDDPKLVELARRAAGNEEEPFALGDKLRRFVTDYVESKTLNIGFATASEVARTREGDCSEHGVLLAALGRLNGLPSRVAVGLAYVPIFGGEDDIFGYHMWTQFHIDGRWIDFDAALRESVCSPIRLTFATSSLKNAGIADLSLPLISKLGAIDLKILEIE